MVGGDNKDYFNLKKISHLPRPLAAGNILRGFKGGYPPLRASALWYNRGICQVIP